MMMTKRSVREWADFYHDLGWAVIPIPYGQKAAKVKWKRYQESQADIGQLGKWFGRNGPLNIAAILGSGSGGLACRDFDSMGEYELWSQQHPDLAKILPTVKTCKGKHVYFQSADQYLTVKHIANGELRISGGYCVLPPSLHPDQVFYEWITPPTAENIIHLDNPLEIFTGQLTERTERTEDYRENRGDKEKRDGLLSDYVDNAISATLPQETGKRHRLIFEFARHLKSNPEYENMKARELRHFVKEWHRQALSKIRTKSFAETWLDFVNGWDKVRHKIGDDSMSEAVTKAKKAKPPQFLVDEYPDDKELQLLGSLCRELQKEHGEEPFFIGCRKAGEVLGKSHEQARGWLELLVADGMLELVCKGGGKDNPRNATRYYYIGD